MKRLSSIAVVALCSSIALAEQTVRELSWAKLKAEGKLKGGVVIVSEKKDAPALLKVVNATGKAATVNILTIDKPPITTAEYALTGRVRCEGVEGQGYLEMWNVFAGGKAFFSRTAAETGPMKGFTATSGWRRLVLPFYSKKGAPPPQKLVVNVVLPGRGTVVLGPLRLVQYEAREDPFAVPGQWWDNRTAGLLGGILGGAMGCLGAAIGVLSSRGKARRFVVGAFRAMGVFGLIALAVGSAAVLQSQPYAVYYPLLLLGVLCTALPLGLLRVVRRRYEEFELRHMAAQDMA